MSTAPDSGMLLRTTLAGRAVGPGNEICGLKGELSMKQRIITATVVAALGMFASAACAADGGEAVFKAKCASCHPNGGNIINQSKTLKGIKDVKKITSKIRAGGGGMTAFDAKNVSDADAKLVADYIIKTFKK